MKKGRSVKVGNSQFPYHVWHKDGVRYLRCYYRDHNGKRKSLTSRYRDESDEKDFRGKVKRKAMELQSGYIELTKLDHQTKTVLLHLVSELPTLGEIEEFISWRGSKVSKVTLSELCDAFLLDKKENSGVSYSYYLEIEKNCSRLLRGVPGDKRLTDISYRTLSMWHESEFGSLSASSRNNARRFLVTLFKWAQRKGMYPDGVLPPERLTTVSERKSKREVLAFTPEEGSVLLDNVKDKYLGWLVLCGWNGLRSEEVATKPKDPKRALMWEDIIWEKNIIIVPPETTKTGYKRVIPLHEITKKYLKRISKESGRVCESSPTRGGSIPEHKRLGALVGKWKKNGLRNSYISYRGTQVGLAKVAMESGNSESVCKSNYLDATTEESASEWFSL